MTAKEYLKLFRAYTEKIRQLENDLKTLEAERDNIRILADGMPSTGKISKRVEMIAVKIVDLQERTMEERAKYLEKRAEVRQVILMVPDDRQSRVLDLRYIQGKSWEEIADIMGFGERQIYRFHGYGLLQVEKIINR